MLSVTHGPASLWGEGRTLNTQCSFLLFTWQPRSQCSLPFAILFTYIQFLSEQINDQSKKSDDESEDEDDPAKLQKKRDWDEWKDG